MCNYLNSLNCRHPRIDDILQLDINCINLGFLTRLKSPVRKVGKTPFSTLELVFMSNMDSGCGNRR